MIFYKCDGCGRETVTRTELRKFTKHLTEAIKPTVINRAVVDRTFCSITQTREYDLCPKCYKEINKAFDALRHRPH